MAAAFSLASRASSSAPFKSVVRYVVQERPGPRQIPVAVQGLLKVPEREAQAGSRGVGLFEFEARFRLDEAADNEQRAVQLLGRVLQLGLDGVSAHGGRVDAPVRDGHGGSFGVGAGLGRGALGELVAGVGGEED
ncbi:hypothetical protein PG985_011246 [Apiospora marii]|uniref:Uncharacterized protein n=1 Tax=Apiospora marii TaxID=335849 RepID=A0ABR1ST52_9PEZI